MRKAALGALLVPALALAAPPRHFDVQASFVPPGKAGANGAVAVSFTPLDPNVHINETPAPRLKLDPSQTVLVDRQAAPEPSTAGEPPAARYLDLDAPVRFAVAFAKGAPSGRQTVKAAVTYFYCSKTEGWCRKGTTPVEIAVLVP